MTSTENSITVKMSPYIRWMTTFREEVQNFPDFFNKDILDRLSARYHSAEDTWKKTFQSLVKIDLVLLLALYSPNLPKDLEIAGFKLSQFEFAIEVLLVGSSLVFMTMLSGFITARAYEAMVEYICDDICKDKDKKEDWNGKYATSVYINQELALHTSSKNLHIGYENRDRWETKTKTLGSQSIFELSVLLILVPFALLHFGVTLWAFFKLASSPPLSIWIDCPIALFAIATNICGILFFYLTWFSEIEFQKPFIAPNKKT